MSANFFDNRCQEPLISAQLFGLCDDQNGLKAYTNVLAPNTWVATVENPETKPVIFTAIDNCLEILRGDGTMEKRCDGMLTYTDNIVFVELKEVEKAM